MSAQIPDWTPRTLYKRGDIVLDSEKDFVISDNPRTTRAHTIEGGIFRAIVSHRSGLLNPRIIDVDRPGKFWKRITRQ